MREQKGKLSPDLSVLSAEHESCHSVAPTDTPHQQGFLQGSSASVQLLSDRTETR